MSLWRHLLVALYAKSPQRRILDRKPHNSYNVAVHQCIASAIVSAQLSHTTTSELSRTLPYAAGNMCRLAAHGFDVSPEPWRISVLCRGCYEPSSCRGGMKVGGLKLQRWRDCTTWSRTYPKFRMPRFDEQAISLALL